MCVQLDKTRNTRVFLIVKLLRNKIIYFGITRQHWFKISFTFD